MHTAVEIVGIVFVTLGCGFGILLMLIAILAPISLILDRLRAFKEAFRKNRVVRNAVREVKRRRLGFKKHDPLLVYPNKTAHHDASFFDQIGIYRRDMDWGD